MVAMGDLALLGWALGGWGDARGGADELGATRSTAWRARRSGSVPMWFFAVAGGVRGRRRRDRRARACAASMKRCALADRNRTAIRRRFPHRLRGEILLKRDPAETRAGEEAFRTAIAVAREQGARSFGLRAALVARQALPIYRPPRRGARCSRTRARRLFADAGNARDR